MLEWALMLGEVWAQVKAWGSVLGLVLESVLGLVQGLVSALEPGLVQVLEAVKALE